LKTHTGGGKFARIGDSLREIEQYYRSVEAQSPHGLGWQASL